MKNKRIEYISLASVLSAIAVVFIHANEYVGEFSYTRYWVTTNFIHSFFIFAVPVFFMVSGAMLLEFNKKYSLKTYFSKRVRKTVIPYIFWSAFGLLFQIFYLNAISNIDLNYIIGCFLTGRAIVVYWFFSPLFALYILFTVFVYFVNTKKHCLLFLTVLFILNGVLYFYNVGIVAYSFLAVFGFYIHKYGIPQKVRIMFYLLAIIGFLANSFGSYYLSITSGELIRTYLNYNFIPAMLYPCGLFIFIKYNLVKIMKYGTIKKTVLFLDFYTFGIYLIHWYILQILIKSFNINIHSIIFRLGAPFVVICISVGIIYLIRKIPYMKIIVP